MSESKAQSLFRKIPSVDKMLSQTSVTSLRKIYSETTVKRIVRKALESLRLGILSGEISEGDFDSVDLDKLLNTEADRLYGRKLRTLVNATGVIVHTNLGRSPLPKPVIDRITEVAMSYSNLEYDVDKGSRGDRNSHLRVLIEELTGAESALAVNNNAAAVLLALSTIPRTRPHRCDHPSLAGKT